MKILTEILAHFVVTAFPECKFKKVETAAVAFFVSTPIDDGTVYKRQGNFVATHDCTKKATAAFSTFFFENTRKKLREKYHSINSKFSTRPHFYVTLFKYSCRRNGCPVVFRNCLIRLTPDFSKNVQNFERVYIEEMIR